MNCLGNCLALHKTYRGDITGKTGELISTINDMRSRRVSVTMNDEEMNGGEDVDNENVFEETAGDEY